MSYYTNTNPTTNTGFIGNSLSLFQDESTSRQASRYQGTRFINTKTGYANVFVGRARDREVTPIRDALELPAAIPTPTVDESAASEIAESATHAAPNGDAERLARERVLLLAKLSARSPGETETASRLEILNERLLRIAPRVSAEQVAVVAGMAEQLEHSVAARNARAQEREARRARHAASGRT